MEISFDILLNKFLRDDDLTAGELELFLILAKQPDNQDKLYKAIDAELRDKPVENLSGKHRKAEMFQLMLAKAADLSSMKNEGSEMVSLRPGGNLFPWGRVAAATVLLAGIVALCLMLIPNSQERLVIQKKAIESTNDVAPGGNKAVLTLANGSEIVLDGASNGILTHQGNTKVVKMANGQLTYQALRRTSEEVVQNTMSTPRGGQYRLGLPDGTQVWLNAASSITYPTAFIGRERKVKLKGEAYFEVRHDHQKPFSVEVNGMEVSVLGTHFNVNAYNDETTIKTTLLEGAVRIAKDGAKLLLKPGQQAQLEKSGDIKLVEGADIEGAVAWKSGLFSFRDADVTSMMRQLSRWYDLDVKYEGEISKKRFSGQVFRNLNLSEALRVLELSGIRFRIEGKRLTVTH
jgi:ferric-dicitrate binding protein FerR (iron transport regulator)